MKKDNRKQYLQVWLNYLKGKKEINYQDLVKLLENKFKASYSSITLKRYSSTLIGNLIQNGYFSGEWGRGVKPGALSIIKKVSMSVLDKCLTRGYLKVHFAEEDLTQAQQPKAPRGRARKVPKKTAKASQKKSQSRSLRTKPTEKKIATIPSRRMQRKDLSRTEQTAFNTAQKLLEQISVLEKQNAVFERVFQSLRELFNQEVIDMEGRIKRFLR